MVNKFKYNKTGIETDSLFKGNWAIDTTASNTGGGPSLTTGLYSGAPIPNGGYTIYSPIEAYSAGTDDQLLGKVKKLGGDWSSVSAALIWAATQPVIVIVNKAFDNLVTDGLVLNLDASNISSFTDSEPTTNLVVYGTMLPTDPNTTFISNSTSQSNVGGSLWTWSVYPNSNISPEGGMEWHPAIPDPIGGSGAWLMKKRPGGNSESNWSSTPPGAIDETKDYTISVWCKTDQASCFRIHINTTKNGLGYWGYASAFHSGNGLWEKLSLTIPANNGNTSINVIRCQALYQYDADAYYKYFQVEEGSSATPFVDGTRLQNTGLYDLSNSDNHGVLTNGPTFNSNGWVEFDGTDDEVIVPDLGEQLQDFGVTIDVKWNQNSIISSTAFGDIVCPSQLGISDLGTGPTLYFQLRGNAVQFRWQRAGGDATISPSTPQEINRWGLYTGVLSSNGNSLYKNGELIGTTPHSKTFLPWYNNTLKLARNAYNNVLNGKISETKVYDKALSQSEILQNYYQAPIVTDGLVLAVDAGNLVSYENGAATTYNLAGSGAGTLANAVGFNKGNGGSWTFDGNDDYMTLPSPMIPATTNWTYSCWFNADTLVAGGVLYCQYTSQSGNGRILINLAEENFKLCIRLLSGPGYGSVVVFSNVIPTVGQYYNFVISRNSRTYNLYINGLLDTSYTATFDASIQQTTPVIGGRATSQVYPVPASSNFFNGKIAATDIYNRALSSDEVTQNFNAQRNRFGI